MAADAAAARAGGDNFSAAYQVGLERKDHVNLNAHGLDGPPSPGQGTSFDDDHARVAAKGSAALHGLDDAVEPDVLNPDVLPATCCDPERTYGVSPTDFIDFEGALGSRLTLPMPPASPMHQPHYLGGLEGAASAGGIGMATPDYTEPTGMMASGGGPRRPSCRGEGNTKRDRQAAPDTGADSRPSQRQRTDVGPVEPYVAAEDAGPGRVVCPGCNKKRDVTKMHPHQQSHLPRWQQTNVCDGRCAGAVFVSRCWCDHVCVPQHVKNASSATPRA